MPELERTSTRSSISSGEHKSWTCAECDTPFTKSKLLENHARHTRHKAYSCVICNKAFNLRTAMVRHESSHSIRKKHACSRCSYAFHRRDHCQDHEAVCRAKPTTEQQLPGSRTISRSRSTSAKDMSLEAQTLPTQATNDVSHSQYDKPTSHDASGTQPNAEVTTIDRNAWEASVRGRGRSKARSRHPANPMNLGKPSSTFDANLRHPTEITHPEIVPSTSLGSTQSTAKRPDGSRYGTGTYTCTTHGCTQRFETLQGLYRHMLDFHRSPWSQPLVNEDFGELDMWPEHQQHPRAVTQPPAAPSHLATASDSLPATLIQQYPPLVELAWHAISRSRSQSRERSGGKEDSSDSFDSRKSHDEWQEHEDQWQGLSEGRQKLRGQYYDYLNPFEGR